MNRLVTLVALFGIAALSPGAFCAEPLQYNRDIRPILAEHCFACHGTDSATREADLRLDRREDAVSLGAIAPGDPERSELVVRVLSDDDELRMPPPGTKKTLTEPQKKLLAEWIAAGAEYQPHWSLIAPVPVEPPAVDDEAWVRHAIDRFVLERLGREGLEPAPEADPRTLFRRLHFDVTGLPPEPSDLAAFVEDYRLRKDLALSAWIDRLMESTAWGEHRARYWLDAARYADTHGLHFDNYREMWPYRDWVIRAFNANQPFDRFAMEQLAGDLLEQPTDDQLIATGFQRCNMTTNEGGTIDEENLAIYATDRVQTFGWVFLGLTTNCAQCHDHKFDPITMRDFYSLAAYFGNTTAPAKDGNSKDGKGPVLIVPSAQDRQRWSALPAEIAAAESRIAERRELSALEFDTWLAGVTPDSIAEVPGDGLRLHLPIDEGSGDLLRNLVSMPASFRVTGPIQWQSEGRLGPALLIGKGTSLELGDVGDFEKDQAFSFGCWAKTTDEAARRGVNAAILARMDQGNGHRGWDLWQQGTALAVHLIDSWDGNALKVSTKQGVVTPGKWQHLLATYDGSGVPSGVKIYVDGESLPLEVEKNTLQEDASLRATTPLRVGRRSRDSLFEGGLVQDVRIYDRLLNSDEARRLAKVALFRAILDIAEQERSPQQRSELQSYYLLTHDSEYPSLAAAATKLRKEREVIRARSPITHIQREKSASPPKANILMRGAYDRPGEEVTAGTPAALHPLPAGAPTNRMGLAMWVVDRSNPLTSRVTVNRFWLEVFGQGLVGTPEDFGVSGALPSHPELLDWLARDFVDSGWDVKRYFKQLFMSATYRQAATATPEKLAKDPSNALMSRGPRFRMDAEMVRDTALAVSDLLSRRMYGPGTRPYQPENIWEIVGLAGGDTRNYQQDQGESLYRRTVYNFWKRMAPPPSLEAFNAPSREVCTIQRERTNTPLQALVTLNDPQFVEAARRLAENALRTTRGGDVHGDDDATLDYIAQRVLSRPLSKEEQSLVRAAQTDYLEYYREHATHADALIAVGEATVEEGIDAASLAAWSLVCNQLMNLDEALNK